MATKAKKYPIRKGDYVYCEGWSKSELGRQLYGDLDCVIAETPRGTYIYSSSDQMRTELEPDRIPQVFRVLRMAESDLEVTTLRRIKNTKTAREIVLLAERELVESLKKRAEQ